MKDDRKNLVPIKPKLDPAAVLEGIRAQVDYKVAPAEVEKPITYVVCKNGLFEIRSSPLCNIVTRPKEVLGVLEEGKEGITWNLPKIPFEFLLQTISFFRGVCERRSQSSEAIVQIWWDLTDKKHIINVPDHDASGGSVHHRSSFDRENSGRYIHVADIHSHGTTMGAFWSGTDTSDEMKVTSERMFGVIGKVAQPVPEWLWRMRTRDGFIELNITEVFEFPEATTTSFIVKMRDIFKLINNKEAHVGGKINIECPVAPIANVKVPEEWYALVKGYNGTQHQSDQHCLGYGRPGFGGGVSRFPAITRGYIYINGEEYEVSDNVTKATGNKLIKRGEQANV